MCECLPTQYSVLLCRQLCQVATEESAKELQILYHAEKDLPGQNPYFDALYRARARALVQENDYCFKVEYVCHVVTCGSDVYVTRIQGYVLYE